LSDLITPPFQETYDGVPLIEFHEDARDLNLFLKFLYEPVVHAVLPLYRGETPILPTKCSDP